MPSSETQTIKEVNNLKVALQRSKNPESTLDILTQLDKQPVNLDILQKTLVAKAVNSLTKDSSSADVKSKGKEIIKKWKRIAKESGVAASRSSSEKSSAQKQQAPEKKAIARQDSNALTTQQDWSKLPPLRRNICTKLLDTLFGDGSLGDSQMPADVLKELCANRAEEIETKIYVKFPEKSAYTNKARQLAFNLKKNQDLKEVVVMGAVPPEKLVSMTVEELADDATKKEREKLVQDINDSRRLDWDQANESKINETCGIKGDLLKASLFTCGRCKSTKTTSTQKQTRSADEPMTVFVW
eukprot:CAMPEP_0196818440 /NCGR_PEP_ID=MMETSP1362-20130617/65572_1 /TAXON_ID=163516 /ORGANISM="Leptocylindrus danicus, Strain CCMP1856" /LENGTH=298 /DNA_ID=CAMNT_0042196543 /DNA_START=20 /DNA_END=913 /DNA_ORIENTATION=+